MDTLVPALAVVQASEERSLVRTMINSLPTDPASLFVLALVLGATILVIVYGRKDGADEDLKK